MQAWVKRLIVGLVAATLPLVVAAAPVGAASPSAMSGTFVFTLSPLSSRSADGNTFIQGTFVEVLSGSMDGTRVGTASLEIHPDGSVNAQDSGVFTGTIDGVAGSVVLRASASGTFAAITANFNVGDGTGGLTAVHATGTAEGAATGPTGFAGSYSGQLVTS